MQFLIILYDFVLLGLLSSLNWELLWRLCRWLLNYCRFCSLLLFLFTRFILGWLLEEWIIIYRLLALYIWLLLLYLFFSCLQLFLWKWLYYFLITYFRSCFLLFLSFLFIKWHFCWSLIIFLLLFFFFLFFCVNFLLFS